MKMSIVYSVRTITGLLILAAVVCAQPTQGVPGVDYPNYHSIPETSFRCSDQKFIPGFYADQETGCQIFHFCFKDRQESFLCPTGTIFNQATLACDSWEASNCSLAGLLYNVNAGPVLESAVRKLPMLMKLKNRSQGKSMTASPPNILEKISSLYEIGIDSKASNEEPETSNLSGYSNDGFNSNVSDKSSDKSAENSEGLEINQLQEGLSEAEQNLQEDAVVEDERYEGSESMNVELNEGSDIDQFYDPVTGGYYMDYNPYQWQDSEPASEEFRNFYENQNDEYEALFQDDDDSVDIQAEPLPENYDLNAVGQDETLEFSKRQLESTKRRRRPMYWVVADEDEQDASLASDSGYGVLGDESSTEQSAFDATEASTEFPLEIEFSENREGTEVSEEVLRSLQFREQSFTFPTKNQLTADQFRDLLMAELVQGNEDEMSDEPQADSEAEEEETYEESTEDILSSFQGDDLSINPQDITSDGTYDLDSTAYDFDTEMEEMSASDSSMHEYDGSKQSEDELQGEEADDTFLIIPDESDTDESHYSSDDIDVEESEDEYVTEGYGYEETANQQLDEENLSDEGYDVDEYESTYGYYKSRREHSEVYEDAEQPYEYDYAGPYGRQYMPKEVYEGSEYDTNVDYTDYSPEEAARLAYFSSLRNSDPYSYMQQRYPQSGYMDTIYNTDGYYRDDFSRNRYAAPDYYASDETSDYYGQSDSPWVQQYSDQEYELENQLDVTDSPLPVDESGTDYVTRTPLPLAESEAEVEDPDDFLNSVEPEDEDAEDIDDFTQDDQTSNQRDAYYIFNFDEDDEEKASMDEVNDSVLRLDDELLEPDDESLGIDDFSEQLNLQEILGSEDLQADESVLNENITIYKDDNGISAESMESERNEEQSFDELLTSQTDSVKETVGYESKAAFNSKPVADIWSSFVTESSQSDKPVTLSSAFERLSALNSVNTPRDSAVSMDFPADTRFSNNIAFSESMDFGPYGYGTNMGQFNMMNSMQPSNPTDSFSHRTGGNEQGGKVPRLSSIQEKLRSMKQGKFGAFKRYMNSMKKS